MNPEDRMTIDQAISHPYLRNHFIEDKVVVQEQPNMLQTTRNLTIPRNDSKLSMVREEEAAEFERIPEKEMSNMNRNKYPEMIKKEPQTNKATIPRERQNYSQLSKYGSIHKIFPKKSESNFHNTL